MTSRLRNSILFLFICWITTACNENTLYHSYQSIPREGWNRNDTLVFNVPIADSLTVLHLSAEVRNESNYPYRNLYLTVSQNLEDSTTWKTDTLLFVLANKDSKWIGTGWGSLFQSDLPVRDIATRHSGNYKIRVTHGMKDDTLKGISDIGIKIER